MNAKNKRYNFTPALWAKWMARQNHPHAAHLRAGIEQMRRSFSHRVATTVTLNASVDVEEIKAVLEQLVARN